MASRSTPMTNQLADYLRKVSLRDTALMARLREETAKQRYALMQISPEQGQFMALLVELIGARRTLEVGVFTGYSTLCVALALPADGRVVACDIDPKMTAIAQRYWTEAGVADKIDLRVAPAAETLDGLLANGQAGSFDFAFVDADKANYGTYVEQALALLRPGGLLAVDNVLWDGKVADPSADDEDTLAIRAVNESLHRDERVSLSLVPIGDGLTLARKR